MSLSAAIKCLVVSIRSIRNFGKIILSQWLVIVINDIVIISNKWFSNLSLSEIYFKYFRYSLNELLLVVQNFVFVGWQ